MNLKHYLLVLASSLVVSAILYGNTGRGEFVYDDLFITTREELRHAKNIPKLFFTSYIPKNIQAGVWRPLTDVTFAANFSLFGESTVSFHLVNIILNGLVTFLVFVLIFQLFNNLPLATLSSLIFAFLPIHSEAVASIKSRDEISAAFFALASWLAFWAGVKKPNVSYKLIFLSSFLFFLAALSKETIFIVPVLFLAVFYLLQKPAPATLLKISATYLPLALIYLALRIKVLGAAALGSDNAFFVINPLADADLPTRIFTAAKIAFILFAKTVIPHNLSATYTYNQLTLVANPFKSPQTLLGFLLIIFLISPLLFKKVPKIVKVGLLILLVPYLVVSKLIFTGGEIAAERWMYFPSIGIALVLGFALTKTFALKRTLAILITLAILTAYTAVLVDRNKVWTGEMALYQSMVKTAPQSIQGHLNLAIEYLNQDKLQETKASAQRAYEIYPHHPPVLNILAQIAVKENDYPKAEELLLRSIKLAPQIVPTYLDLGLIYFNTGRYQEALQIYELVIKDEPPNYQKISVIGSYALTLAKLKRYEESVKTIYEYAPEAIGDSQIRFVLAVNFYKAGNLGEAKKYFNWDPTKTEAEKITILEDF